MTLVYKCKFCNKEFHRPCGLGLHERTCKLNPNPLFIIRKHFIKNIDNSDRWICPICNEHFRVRKDLENHKKIHVRDVTKSICKFCKQEFFKKSLGAHVINCSLNPNLTKIRKNQIKNNGKRGTHHTEEVKKKISESRKAYLKEHPDKVPYVLNHHRKGDSYPERYFKDVFNNANLQYEFNYKCCSYFIDFAWPENKIYLEIDGDQHYLDKRIVEHDKVRTEKLKENGWKLLKRIRWSEFQKLSIEEREKEIYRTIQTIKIQTVK